MIHYRLTFNLYVMQKNVIIMALSFLVLAGCQKSDDIQNKNEIIQQKTEFVALVQQPECLSKVSLDKNNLVLWEKNDMISIFRKSIVLSQYSLGPECDGSERGTFSYKSGNDMDGDLSHYFAVYPYSSEDVLSEENGLYSFITTFPQQQQYRNGTFDETAFKMIAVSPDKNLSFKNICGVIKVMLTGREKVCRITVTGGSGDFLSGKAILKYRGNEYVNTLPYQSFNSVVLDCMSSGQGVQLSPDQPTAFMLAVPPVNFKNGFVVAVEDQYGNCLKLSAAPGNKVGRNQIMRMPEIEFSIGKDDIVINDNEILVGTVNGVEPANISEYKTKVVKVEGTEYWKFVAEEPLKELYNLPFTGHPDITYVKLPSSVTKIWAHYFERCPNLVEADLSQIKWAREGNRGPDGSIFLNCPALKKIILPTDPGTTEIPQSFCSGCTALESIEIPSNFKRINSYAFSDCTVLKDIRMHEGIEKIEGNAFQGCTQLVTIRIPASVKDINYASGIFNGCTALKNVIFEEGSQLKSLYSQMFENSGVEELICPDGLENLSAFSLYNMPLLKKLVLPLTLKIIGRSAMDGCTKLENFDVPAGVTLIEGGILSGCKSLKTVRFNPGPDCNLASDAFNDSGATPHLYLNEEWNNSPDRKPDMVNMTWNGVKWASITLVKVN